MPVLQDKTLSTNERDLIVGGQAVIEGVMMRTPNAYAIAVRKADGTIVNISARLPKWSDKYPLLKLPVLRGSAVLVQSMGLGIKALNYSANEALVTPRKPKREGSQGRADAGCDRRRRRLCRLDRRGSRTLSGANGETRQRRNEEGRHRRRRRLDRLRDDLQHPAVRRGAVAFDECAFHRRRLGAIARVAAVAAASKPVQRSAGTLDGRRIERSPQCKRRLVLAGVAHRRRLTCIRFVLRSLST